METTPYSEVTELRARAKVQGYEIAELILTDKQIEELSVDQVSRSTGAEDPRYYGLSGDFIVRGGDETAVLTEGGEMIQ